MRAAGDDTTAAPLVHVCSEDSAAGRSLLSVSVSDLKDVRRTTVSFSEAASIDVG
jgi:hypothetical protein